MGKAISGRAAVTLLLAFVSGVQLTACCRGSGTGSESSPTGATATPVATAIPAAKGATPTSPTKAAADPTTTPARIAPGGRGPDGLPAEIPSTRSKVPTLAEWDAVGEITVARSTPLGCETKMVREWLRVSCKGKSHTGGTPANVTKLEGCGADTFLFSKMGNTTSLVTPVLRNKSCEVRFTWMNATAAWLSVDWNVGTPRPVIAFRE